MRALVVLVAVLSLSGCTGHGATLPSTAQPSVAVPSVELPCVQTTHGCTALNPDVTQDNISQTICKSGYTKTVRPSTSYTNGIKAKLMREAGIDSSQMSAYELDHLVPLALGGHPRKLSNLQLQPWYGENSATGKDHLEVRLQHMVCKGKVTLVAAQHCIAENWQGCEADIAAGRMPASGTVVK